MHCASLSSLLGVSLAVELAVASCAVNGTATVDLAVSQGTPAHRASGFLYGITDRLDQVPSHFYTDMGFNYARAGGSQLPAPARRWIHGIDEFEMSRQQMFPPATFPIA